MIAWATVEDALHAWAVAGSGFATSSVIWSQQNGPRPTAPWIELRVFSVRRVGQDWLDVEDNPSGGVGEEIKHLSRGQREVLFQMNCFDGDAGNATGVAMPAAVLDSVMSALNLPGRRDALNTAGIGVARFNPIQSIDGVLGSTILEPRANLQAFFFLASEVEELGTYIQTVEITNLGTGETIVVP